MCVVSSHSDRPLLCSISLKDVTIFIIPVTCGTHLVVLVCMLKMNSSYWFLDFFCTNDNVDRLRLSDNTLSVCSFIKSVDKGPSLWYMVIHYVSIIIPLRSNTLITSCHTLLLRQHWWSPSRPQFLLLQSRSVLRLFIGHIKQPSFSGPQSSHLRYIAIEASLVDLALIVVYSNSAGALSPPTFLCTWQNSSTLLSFIWPYQTMYHNWIY